ncbi:MAG: histidine phosphatase family protein [Lentisphaerae bacterium]|jgi:probable phosphoglycerate mutase|nr:histidine phosphatase family protein [Lentisphaerota bacterium]
MSTRTEMVIVRHGETEGNRTRTLQGQSNTDLNQVGRLQVERLALRLQKQAPFTAVYSSDLQRAMDTARIILEKIPAAPLIPTPALREWNLGHLQGYTWAELEDKSPGVREAFRQGGEDVQAPGGEKRSELEKRVRECLQSLALRHVGERILLVSHGGALRSMFKYVVGVPKAPNLLPVTSNASYNQIVYDNGSWQLLCWNDTAHLEGIELNELVAY